MSCSKASSGWRLAYLLVWSCCGTEILGQAAVDNSNAIQGSGVVTFSLIPHHLQKRRRELETGEVEPKASRPSHYPRFLEDPEPFKEAEIPADNAKDYNPPDAQQVAALFQGYGTHYADLWCGTPPQRQTVIVDTGSGVTAFPCSGCHDCGVPDYHIDKLFTEADSSSFVKLDCGQCLKGSCDESQHSCSMGQSYAEGSSWYAYEAQDACYVGGLHNTAEVDNEDNNKEDPFHAPAFAFNLKFGCQNRITGLFKTQLADGIMGMDKADAAFWKQMYDAKKLSKSAFSLCFSRSDTVQKEGTGAGAMSLGGTDIRLHKTPMVYTSGDDSAGFYRVQIRKAYLREGPGGNSAANLLEKKVVPLDVAESDLNRGNVIVDSGTTDTYFHKAFGSYFTEAFRKITGEAYSNKERTMTLDEVNKYPTILFQLYGDAERNQAVIDENGGLVTGLAQQLDPDHPLDVILAIPPTHYFEYDEEEGKYAARFYADESRGSVLGANAIMGHDVLFDVDNHVLGWAESDCDYSGLVEKFFTGKNDEPASDPIVDPARTETEDSNNNAADEEDESEPEDQSESEGELEMPPAAEPPKQFCTGVGCQIGFSIALVSTIVLVGLRLARRLSSGQSYELSAVELEMQTPPSVLEKGRYRDEDDDGSGTGEFS